MPERPAVALLALAALLVACTPLGDPGGPQPTAVPTAVASASPARSAEVDASPTATAEPTPAPTPTRDPNVPEDLTLEVTGCPGGVVVDWSSTSHPSFHHYIALRSIEPEVSTAYPPIAPAVDWGDSYATDRFVTSAVDSTLIPSSTTLYYRVMAYDIEGRVLAASPVESANLTEVEDLGPLAASRDDETGTTMLDWGLFGGLGRCFTAYQVLIGPAGSVPTSTLTTLAEQATTEVRTAALQPGQSYAIRVDAVRSTTLGSLVVGRSEVTTYTPP
jgi:hypothetical protein